MRHKMNVTLNFQPDQVFQAGFQGLIDNTLNPPVGSQYDVQKGDIIQ